MAAGFSQRMGMDKLFLSFKGKTLIGHAIYLLNQLPVSEKIFITTAPRLERLSLPEGIRAIVNELPHRGKSESVRQGVWAASGEWYLFLNADQPKLNVSAIMPLLELTETTPSKIIYPVVNGKPSSPTLFHRDYRAALLTITGDEGGKTLRDASVWACHPYIVEKPELFVDLDTPQDARTIK